MTSRHRESVNAGPSGTHCHNTVGCVTFTPSIVQSIDDVVTPGFLQKQKRGEVINNPCLNVKTTIDRIGVGSYYAYRKSDNVLVYTNTGTGNLTYWTTTKGWNPGLPSVSGLVPDKEAYLQQAKVKALANVNRAPYSVLEDIVEIRKTIELLQDPFGTLRTLTHDFVLAKKRLTSLAKYSTNYTRRAKVLANLWAEYRWAFSPLVQTAHNLVRGLLSLKRDYSGLQQAHAILGPFTGQRSGDALAAPFHFTTLAKKNVSYHATVHYRTSPPLREWQYKYGLRLRDVPRVMWDVFPLSFMYDRVFDIGSAIYGLTNFADPSVEILGGCTSVSSEILQQLTLVSQDSGSYNVTINPDSYYVVTTSYDRNEWKPVVTDIIPPVLPEQLLRDITSTVDLTALIMQRIIG